MSGSSDPFPVSLVGAAHQHHDLIKRFLAYVSHNNISVLNHYIPKELLLCKKADRDRADSCLLPVAAANSSEMRLCGGFVCRR